MVFLEVLVMFKRISKMVPFAFFLCLTVLICLVPAAYADGLPELQAAIGRGDETYTLSADTLVPADANIDAGDTELIVPAGTALTVKGFLRVNSLEIQQGGAVYVDGGHLDCPWGLTPNGTLSIRDDWVDNSSFSARMRSLTRHRPGASAIPATRPLRCTGS